MPMLRPRKRASASSPRPEILVPRTFTVPLSGRSSPASAISKVDLPEPDGPRMPTDEPSAMERSIPLRTSTRERPASERRSTLFSTTALPLKPMLPLSMTPRAAWRPIVSGIW